MTTPEQAGTNPAQSGIPANQQVELQQPEQKPDEGTNTPAEVSAEQPVKLELEGAPNGEQIKTPDADRTEAYTYEPTGDAGLDYALAFIGKQGFGPNHPSVLAAQNGDFALIEAELATMGVDGAPQVLALAKQAYTNSVQAAKENTAKLTAFAEQQAGSADNWKAVLAWASANADPAEKTEINAALAAGGFRAQSTIRDLVNLYSKSNTLNKTPVSAAKADAGAGAPASNGGALSAADYAAELSKLRAANRGSLDSANPEYKALQSRRVAGMRKGI